MNEPRIDLDNEAIWLDDRWQKQDELAAAIKAKLDKGDFSVAALSTALEKLHQGIATARVMAFRVEPAMADQLAAHAHKTGTSIGAVLRQAVAQFLAQPSVKTDAAGPEDHANAVALQPKSGAVKASGSDDAERSFFAPR